MPGAPDYVVCTVLQFSFWYTAYASEQKITKDSVIKDSGKDGPVSEERECV